MRAIPRDFGRLILEVGKVRVGFSGPESFVSVLRGRYARFISSLPPELSFELELKKRRSAPYTPRVRRDNGALRLGRGDFDCRLDERRASGRLCLHPAVQTFDSFLRTLLSFTLLRSGGLLLHSAAVIKGGRAFLFPGRSGAGKSTLSRLAASAGAEVISDELNIVRREKRGYVLCGSPFWGEMRSEGRQGTWPLEAVFLIRKARRSRLLGPAPAGPLFSVLRTTMNFSRDGKTAGEALSAAAGLISSVRVRGLAFSDRDAGFLDLLSG